MTKKVFFKKDSVSIIFNEDSENIYFSTFDYEFRLITSFKNPNLYRRGFDNKVLLGNVFSNEAVFLEENESNKVLNEIYKDAIKVFSSKNFHIEMKAQSDEIIEYFIEKSKNTTFEKVVLDSENFRKLYKPISILPPDQYLAFYIPITEGCSYNKCSFCNLYKDRPFRIKKPEEVSNFLDNITNYFGKSLLTRKGIFLGEGNVFVEKTSDIIIAVRIIKNKLKQNEYITFEPENSFSGFMDTFHTKKELDELIQLRNEGINKIFIGLESGSEKILDKLLQKPLNTSNLITTVNNIKKAGINVGITVLVGVGGKELEKEHINDTIQTLFKLKLDGNDIIYLSPIVEYPNLTYSILMNELGLTRLTSDEIKEQTRIFKEFLSSRFPKTKISIYRVDKFVY
jgi:radical SAM superfamily enzyme YgiQ (UPF0313 family)